MAITLRDLARQFEVAPSTISRALSGDSGVGSELAEKIKTVANAAGYRPMPLRRRFNHTIGRVISSASNDKPDDAYHAAVISRAMEFVAAQGWHLNMEIICRDGGFPKIVAQNRVDGVMLCGFPTEALCRKLKKLNFPAVALDDLFSRTGLPSVIPDIGVATGSIVERLKAMGHQRIAMVATAARYPTMSDRIAGFKGAVKDLNLPKDYLVHASFSNLQQGQIAATQLMGRPKPPTAIVFATDRLALGGMIALGRLGRSIPNDISVAGHDNLFLSTEPDPPITSVDLNLGGMIAQAFARLKDMIEGADVPAAEDQIRIPCEVVWRNSCGPVSAG